MRYRIALPIGLIIGLVLGYGYWHQATHASFYITLQDYSNRERPRPIADAAIVLRDASGAELARYRAEAPYGVMSLSAPASYVCREFEKQAAFSLAARAAWDACSERYARWLSTWTGAVRFADVALGACNLHRVPVTLSQWDKTGWLLWWVPLVHVGGKPYASFSLTLGIDPRQCSVVYQHAGPG